MLTEGFIFMGDEALRSLLEGGELVARDEEAVWEAVVCSKTARWQTRGCELVTDNRFLLRKERYLRARVVGRSLVQRTWIGFRRDGEIAANKGGTRERGRLRIHAVNSSCLGAEDSRGAWGRSGWSTWMEVNSG